MVIVVILKNNFVFEWTISAQCYFKRCCQGEPRIEEFGCCGMDGTNPCGYVSGKGVGEKCREVVCP